MDDTHQCGASTSDLLLSRMYGHPMVEQSGDHPQTRPEALEPCFNSLTELLIITAPASAECFLVGDRPYGRRSWAWLQSLLAMLPLDGAPDKKLMLSSGKEPLKLMLKCTVCTVCWPQCTSCL